MIAQRSNILNYSIAADSREIAEAGKRDSSAMKAIAILTMAFLPGTFVAVRIRYHPNSSNFVRRAKISAGVLRDASL
jgi:hypothetical protein